MSSGEVELGLPQALELLAKLNQAAADVARREEKLVREMGDRRHAVNRKFRDQGARTVAWYEQQIAEARAAAKAAEAAVRQRTEGRHARIQASYKNSLQAVQTKAKRKKEQYHGQLQMAHFRAERQKPEDERALEAAYAEFNQRLAELAARVQAARAEARRLFSGYGALRKLLRRPPAAVEETRKRDELFQAVETDLGTVEEKLAEFRQSAVAAFFGYVHPALLAVLILLLGGAAAYFSPPGRIPIAAAAVLLIAGILVLHRLALGKARPAAEAAADALQRARDDYERCRTEAIAQQERDIAALEERYTIELGEMARNWPKGQEVERRFAAERRQKLEKQILRVLKRNDEPLAARLRAAAETHAPQLGALESEQATRREALATAQQGDLAAIATEEEARWSELEEVWQRDVIPAYELLRAMDHAAGAAFPPWETVAPESWMPQAHFPTLVKFGELALELKELPKSPRLPLPGSPRAAAPAVLTFAERGSLLVESAGQADPQVMGAFNNVLLRLFSSLPPGKLTFTIIDPVGLGQNFAGLMHLADYEESLINRRIWTQRDQIEERLARAERAHREGHPDVSAQRVRDDHRIQRAGRQRGGKVSLPRRRGFSRRASARRRRSGCRASPPAARAAASSRCIHWDQRQPLPDGFVPDELRKSSVCLRAGETGASRWRSARAAAGGAALVLDPPPDADLARRAGAPDRQGAASTRTACEVPFAQIAPTPEELWTSDTTNELRVAIGRTGATKQQYLAIGKGTRQHALFAGKTGSGKSTLFHVIITNLALACSPEQVEFYLIDFKKGVEFKCYATQAAAARARRRHRERPRVCAQRAAARG